MNYNNIIFYDFEATGVNPHTCQPIELAAVVIDGRRLEIKEDECFSSYIKPIFDEERCRKLQLQPLTEEVLKITHIDPEKLKVAPDIKVVWEQFGQFVDKFNYKKTNYTAPIGAGFNTVGYDNIIVNRLCGGHFWQIKSFGFKDYIPDFTEPYGFGPWDEARVQQALFSKYMHIDLMHTVWQWTENMPDIKSISFNNVSDWLGITMDNAHRAISDVVRGATALCRFLKLKRAMTQKVKFAKSFTVEDNAAILRTVAKYV